MRDILRIASSSYPRSLINVNGTLYFNASNGNEGRELWRSDGTCAGTVMVRDILPGASFSSSPRYLTNVNGTLYFGAVSPNAGYQLWKSDGTSAGTQMVADVSPSLLVNVNGVLYFAASSPSAGFELWKSDGTTAGTVIVRDVAVGPAASLTGPLSNVNGRLFFAANDGIYGKELWTSDGTSSGTSRVGDINSGARDSNPSRFLSINGTLFFSANDRTGTELWSVSTDLSIPVLSLTSSAATLPENQGSVQIIAFLDGISTRDTTITLSASGTAIGNLDYSASGLSIVIPAGSLTGAVLLTSINDSTIEGNESVVIDVVNVINGVENGTQQVATTIVDDEGGLDVTIALSPNTLAENAGTAVVRALLSHPATQEVIVNLDFAGQALWGTDFSASSNAIVIQGGETSGSILLRALDDPLLEGAETFVVSIASVFNGTTNGTQQATATITDDASEPLQLIGDALLISGTEGDDTLIIDFANSTVTFTATFNGGSATVTASTITVDGAGGSDSLTVKLSSLADTAAFAGPSGSITSSSYAINYSNVETSVLNGGANDQVTYNDPGVVNTGYLLPQYGILQGVGFRNQAIAFGNHTINAAGNDDNLFIYGDGGVQAYVAMPTQARMPVGSQVLTGNNFKRVYAYGMGGNDTATYSGSALDETMTALWNYVFVNTDSTVQYFDSFKTLTVAGNGGLDIAVMYDTTGVDTFTASDTSFRYTRSGVFNNIANGYDRVYAFNYFGGFDTATLNGSSGNDKLTSVANYSVLVTPTTLQQATGFRTVIVNAGTGNDTATLQDSTGNDTLNAFAATAELIYANGRTARAIGFDTVNVNGTLGGTNRRNVTNPLAYQLKFKGTWVS
ncbi:MAG: hypothetical protein JNM18_11660 [Planctomycetaceae bacterium]|nr:hypothetical protein [Planctomycetaceae bacterium]